VVEDESDVTVGDITVNGSGEEVPPPGAPVKITTWAAPRVSRLAAGIVAVSCVALT
jgi:hypothetical protein